MTRSSTTLALALLLAACKGAEGKDGEPGAQGVAGPAGKDGATGAQGPKGDPGPAGADGQSDTGDGLRLKARYFVGADGSRRFYGWHDTQLDVGCTYQTASDGKQRCLPAAHTGRVLYSDASCQTPVRIATISGYDPSCDSAPAYAIAKHWLEPLPGCFPKDTKDVYSVVLDPNPVAGLYWLVNAADDCQLAASGPSSTLPFSFTFTGPLDPAGFVEGAVQ